MEKLDLAKKEEQTENVHTILFGKQIHMLAILK